MKKLLLLILLLSFSISASAARMYQWIDPDTKTTQLSGNPPHWYRSGEAGPRVVVFESGRVIDDTGIELSQTENARLRQGALVIVESDRLAAMEKLAQSQRQKAALDSESDDEEEELVQSSIEPPPPEQLEDAQREEQDDTTQMAEQMRLLLEQYESVQTQNARELVESVGP